MFGKTRAAQKPGILAVDSGRVMDRGYAEEIDEEALRNPAVLAAWRELAELRENPFLTPEWYTAWLESHPAESPFAIAWRVNGAVRGVLPLVSVSRGPFKLLRFAGARRGDWFTPACRPADEGAMADACVEFLSQKQRRWHAIRLDRIDAQCEWPALLQRADGSRIAVGPRRREDVLPYIAFDERGFDGYMTDKSRNFRSQLGRRRRRLERDHGLTFRMTTASQELEADMDTFFQLHDERWRERGGSSSQSPAVRRHQRLFAATALERGWLRLWTAEADGAPAASWYGWRIGSRYCYALAGLSGRFEPLGLGTVLLAHTIERAAAEGVEVYDLMWGDEDYKRRFETGRRQAATWILSRRGHPMRAAIDLDVRAARAMEAFRPKLGQSLKLVRGAARRS